MHRNFIQGDFVFDCITSLMVVYISVGLTCKALNDFVRYIGSEINGESKGGICLFDQIPQFL